MSFDIKNLIFLELQNDNIPEFGRGNKIMHSSE
jgi:hypothetical protein